MKIIFHIIFLTLFSKLSLGQIFKQYKNTAFYFVSADNKLKGRATTNAYVKKGDTILILSKVDLNNFLTLFEKYPSSFSYLFKNLKWISHKYIASDKFDKVLSQTTYQIHADIRKVTIRKNNGEIIWDITNSDYIIANPSCYASIIFKQKDKTLVDQTNINNLEFVKVSGNYCDY